MDVKTILSDLVAFPSVCETSNRDIADYVRSYLASHGVESDLIPGPEGDRCNLFATIGPKDRPGYILSGHMDVVSAEGQRWSSDPFKLTAADDGRNVARGAVDMKGFIACILATVPEFVSLGLGRPIHIALSYDEEMGCRGVKHLLPAIGGLCEKPLACIVGEPSDMRPVLSHKGKAAIEFLLHGLSGHSSNPALGYNAIYPAADLILRLRDLADRIAAEGPFDHRFDPPFSTLQVGTVNGGTAVNIIPEHCRLEMEVRSIPAQDAAAIVEQATAAAHKIAARACEAGGVLDIRWTETSNYPALAPASDPALAELLVQLTGKQALQSVSYGTEAGLYAEAGIPAIICGPGSIARAHKPDEFILDSELAECLQMMRALGGRLQHD